MKYKALIHEVFASDQSFMGALDKACSSVINYRPNPKQPCRSPELVGYSFYYFYKMKLIIILLLAIILFNEN